MKEVWEVDEAARPGHPHDGLAASQASEVERVRRQLHLPDGRGQALHRHGDRARLHRLDPLLPRPAPGVEDASVRAKLLESGKRVAWGAKTIPSGGYFSIPRSLSVPGMAIAGDAAEHGQRPDPQGRPLRDARRHLRGRGDPRGAQARLGQPRLLRRAGPQVADRQRPVRVAQHAPAVLEGLLRRRGDGERDDDHQGRCFPAASGSTSRTPRSRWATAAPRRPIPKPDNELTFNKLDSVFLSGNATRDDAPNHVRIQSHVPRELAKTWVNLCPAQVYEIPEDQLENGATEVDVQVTASNCVQCGAINAKGGRLDDARRRRRASVSGDLTRRLQSVVFGVVQ